MPNCPDYIAIWLGITRVGGIVSLLNTNLVGDSLAHAINIVEPKHIIVSAALVEAFAAVVPKLSPEIQSWAHGENSHGFSRIDREIERRQEMISPAQSTGRRLSPTVPYISTPPGRQACPRR